MSRLNKEKETEMKRLNHPNHRLRKLAAPRLLLAALPHAMCSTRRSVHWMWDVFGAALLFLTLGQNVRAQGVPFIVSVTPGGPDEGGVGLRCDNVALDGLPGDDWIGDGAYTILLMVETGVITERNFVCR